MTQKSVMDDPRVGLAHTDTLLARACARLVVLRKARLAGHQTLALLVQAPGNAPAYWLKLGKVDAAAWRAGQEHLPLGPVRVGECYFAYANGAGAVGMLSVTRHGAEWCLRVPTLGDALPPASLRSLGLHHPSRTVMPLAQGKADILYESIVSRLTGISL